MWNTVFKPWIKSLLNLIYPASCLICKTALNPLSHQPLCARCWRQIQFSLPATNQAQASAGRIYSVCIYEGIIKQSIHLFKYKNKLSLAKPLGRLMVEFAGNFLNMQEINLVLPVPLHSRKLRLRQFNQAQLLAGCLSRAFSKKLVANLLIKIKQGPAQVSLKRRARLQNVQGSFKVRNVSLLKNKNVLLIDDVLTTQATAGECRRVLLAAGANRVDVLTLARGI